VDETWRLAAEGHAIPVEDRLAWFFPAEYTEETGYESMYWTETGAMTLAHANAKAVCRRCPVQVECLAWAVENRPIGIWAGTTERQRRNMPKERKSA